MSKEEARLVFLALCSGYIFFFLDDNFQINFIKLPLILQKRFIEIADTYEKSKLQQVCKKMNDLIKPESLQCIKNLVIYPDKAHEENHIFWGRRGGYRDAMHIHPSYQSHLRFLENLIINRSLNGNRLLDNYLTTILNQNVTFYLKKLHLEKCNLTGKEFKSLADYGGLEMLFLQDVEITPPPKAAQLAKWTANCSRIHIHIKNFHGEPNWPLFFDRASSKRILEYFYIRQVSMKLNPNDLDHFILVSWEKCVDNLYTNISIFRPEWFIVSSIANILTSS